MAVFRFALSLAALLCSFTAAPALSQERSSAVLLVAAPSLQDPNFAQTVVLVVTPAHGGPLGVILNRPTRFALKDVFPAEPRLLDRSEPVYFGGPVQPGGLTFLFRVAPPAPTAAFLVLDDLFLSADGELLDRLLERTTPVVHRYFLGYSGWSSDQLDFEIAQGAWYVLPADADSILRMEPKTMWRELLARATAIKT